MTNPQTHNFSVILEWEEKNARILLKIHKGITGLTKKTVDMEKRFTAMEKGIKRTSQATKEWERSTSNLLKITLPLIFGFQAVEKAMSNLIDPAMELVGVQKLYQQFLAIKYLPTALKQLDNVLELGEAWGDQSEKSRTAEGDLALNAKMMAEITQQTAMAINTFTAFTSVIPDLGLDLSEALGAALGITTELTLGTIVMADEQLRAQAQVGGWGDATATAGLHVVDNMMENIAEGAEKITGVLAAPMKAMGLDFEFDFTAPGMPQILTDYEYVKDKNVDITITTTRVEGPPANANFSPTVGGETYRPMTNTDKYYQPPAPAPTPANELSLPSISNPFQNQSIETNTNNIYLEPSQSDFAADFIDILRNAPAENWLNIQSLTNKFSGG